MKEVGEKATVGARVGHLLRVTGYLEIAIICMWTHNPRTLLTIGIIDAGAVTHKSSRFGKVAGSVNSWNRIQ